MKVTIYTDGGSRGNPGPSALGVSIQNADGAVIDAYGEFLGQQTNNYAEYMAVISALKKAEKIGATEVDIIADSKLVVEQLNQNWKVKHPVMQQLFVRAWNQKQKFKKVTFRHTRRENNKEADAEVNKVLDEEAKKE